MSHRNLPLVAALTAACLGTLLTSALAQPAPQTAPSQPATTSATQAFGRGGRGPSVPGMTAAQRDAFVGVRSNNTYTPMPKKDANGQLLPQEPVGVKPLTDELYQTYGDSRGGTLIPLDRFYTKCLKINGVLVVGSPRVSDYAFLEAAYTLDHQFHDSPQWVKEMFERLKIRLAILSVVEFTMDLPENNRGGRNSDLANALYQDGRSRGLGGMPWCSCAEENLLNLRGDRYGGDDVRDFGENITIHEFSHTTASAIGATQGQGRGARGRPAGPFWDALRKAFADSTAPDGRLGKWNASHGRNGQPGRVYASTDEQEFWAEGAQAWFDNARPGNSGGISKRQDVKDQDPELAALLKEIYGDGEWRYIKTTAQNPDGTPKRPASELAHLAGIDPLRGNKIPNFNNNNSPRVQAAATQPDIAGARGGFGGGRGRGRGAATSTAPASMTAPATAASGN